MSSHRLAVAALRALPQHAMSRAAGWLASRRLPAALRGPAVRAFGRAVGVDFSEVRDPLDRFASLQEFFTRALRDGARPIDPAPEAFVSPCDGSWGAAGVVERGQLLQVKGRPYRLAALLGDDAAARAFEGGAFATLYLSPRDYHRFHTPCAARVTRATYLPGALWPVNRIGVEGVDGLFAVNERIAAFFSRDGRSEAFCLVAVGATMVGKIRLTFDELTTNLPHVAVTRRAYADLHFAKGEEWGRFEFGSTIVLVAAPGALALDVRPPGTPVRLGARIGTLLGER
ncbi:MAG: archaetidylserine decarboxylase [Deltaproteobacteria bacterium]|nr:archaetidylserine decarboxylase [Deltaproteobacteria bacterium]